MVQITTLTDDAVQSMELQLADGSTFTITVYYKPTVQRWIADIAYGSFVANSLDLCVHPNILRTWRNVIPFGLTITSSDGADPFNVADFINGRISVYVLDNTGGNTDVEKVEQDVFGEAA